MGCAMVFEPSVASAYAPRGSKVVCAFTFSRTPFVLLSRITFFSTIRSDGVLTEKYGSAVTIMPKDCSAVVTVMLFFVPAGKISPRLAGRPSGVIAHST